MQHLCLQFLCKKGKGKERDCVPSIEDAGKQTKPSPGKHMAIESQDGN